MKITRASAVRSELFAVCVSLGFLGLSRGPLAAQESEARPADGQHPEGARPPDGSRPAAGPRPEGEARPADGHRPEGGPRPGGPGAAEAVAEVTRRSERWKLFREHVEKIGRKDLLPAEEPGAKPPGADAIIGILFRLSPDLAAADEHLESDPPDAAKARARLERLKDTPDPYLADYARLLGARCDLVEKRYEEARQGFEAVLGSKRNLAAPAARRGLAEAFRGLGETTFEVLELRMLLAGLPPEKTADRSWAEGRLAEIRRDHPGPLADSEKRIRQVSAKLTESQDAKAAPGEQKEVEDILEKVARILEEAMARALELQALQAAAESGQGRGQGRPPPRGNRGNRPANAQAKDGKDKDKRQGPADDSRVAREKARDKKLGESDASDTDAWGAVNEKEVARALQDLWGKIPPRYRQVVAQYFRDISGLDSPASVAPRRTPSSLKPSTPPGAQAEPRAAAGGPAPAAGAQAEGSPSQPAGKR